MNCSTLHNPAQATVISSGLGSLHRRGWWQHIQPPRSNMLPDMGGHIPTASCCRSHSIPAVTALFTTFDASWVPQWLFQFNYQVKDLPSCWECQVNGLPTSEVSNKWEDQQQEHTSWAGQGAEEQTPRFGSGELPEKVSLSFGLYLVIADSPKSAYLKTTHSWPIMTWSQLSVSNKTVAQR